jgi:type III secretion system FlhB-like substrate exporter
LRGCRGVAEDDQLVSQLLSHAVIEVEISHQLYSVFAAIFPSITALFRL